MGETRVKTSNFGGTCRKGLMLICKKYYNDKKTRTNIQVNNSYIFKKFVGNNVLLYDDVDEITYTIPRDILRDNFIYPYCRTIDSQQGATIDDKVTLFNLNSPFVDRQRLWVALTRASELKNITVFLDSDESVDFSKNSILDRYLTNKIQNYKQQDKQARREYKETEYIDNAWIKHEILSSKSCCHLCSNVIDITIENCVVITDLSIDRKNNDLAHVKNNCQITHLLCNTSKSNRT
jgi:hypothetical protein